MSHKFEQCLKQAGITVHDHPERSGFMVGKRGDSDGNPIIFRKPETPMDRDVLCQHLKEHFGV